MSIKSYAGTALILFAGFAAGCASATPPVQDIKIAKMALLNATEAETDTEAKRYYAKAKAYLLQAQTMMKKKKYDEAKYFAQKATAEARVAKIKATNAVLLQKVDALDTELKKLKHEFVTIEEEK